MQRKESRARQTDGNCDICQWQQSDGGRKWETGRHGAGIAFSFSPFSFPLADSEELMKEQSMIICCSPIPCSPLPCQAWGEVEWWQSCHGFRGGRSSYCECLHVFVIVDLLWISLSRRSLTALERRSVVPRGFFINMNSPCRCVVVFLFCF